MRTRSSFGVRSRVSAGLVVGAAGLLMVGFVGCSSVDTVADAGGDAAADGAAADGAATDTSPPLDAPTDATPSDATPSDASPTDSGDASTCVPAPAVGTPCVSGQKSCEKIDGCCLPQVVCDATKGTWELLYLRCPCQGVTCGGTTCPGTQFCRARASGVDGGATTYECADYPPACERQWTCACLNANSSLACTQPPQASCRDQGGRPYQSCAGQ